ncbi:MAG: Mur ligase domain-containing protein, partial [Gemmatimonadales bacterium]
MTTLSDVVAALRQSGLLAAEPVGELPAITGITADSRRLTAGMLYCAVRGSVQDGHGYLPTVEQGGAAAALVEAPVAIALPQIVVRDGRRAAAVAAELWYGRPATRLDLIGVTGTNGKSTTVM